MILIQLGCGPEESPPWRLDPNLARPSALTRLKLSEIPDRIVLWCHQNIPEAQKLLVSVMPRHFP